MSRKDWSVLTYVCSTYSASSYASKGDTRFPWKYFSLKIKTPSGVCETSPLGCTFEMQWP